MVTLIVALPIPRLVLLIVVTTLNGMMLTEPSAARSRIVRIDRFSTVPENPAAVTTSPTSISFSSSKDMPVMTSCTKECEDADSHREDTAERQVVATDALAEPAIEPRKIVIYPEDAIKGGQRQDRDQTRQDCPEDCDDAKAQQAGIAVSDAERPNHP